MLESLFSEDKTQAETPTEETVEEIQTEETETRPPETPEEIEHSDDNTEEKSHKQEAEADTSEKDDTKPKLERVKLKQIDDSEYEVDLPEDVAELVKQADNMQAYFRQKSQENAERQRNLETGLTEQKSKLDSMVHDLGAQLLFMQNEFSSEEMQYLKEYNRAEYDKRVDAYNQRFEAYQKFTQQQQQEYTQQVQQQQQAYIEEQREQLRTLVPEWLEKDKFQAEKPEIEKYAKSIGFTDQELSGISKASAIKMMRDAYLWNKSQENIKQNRSKPAASPMKQQGKPAKPAKAAKSDADLFYSD